MLARMTPGLIGFRPKEIVTGRLKPGFVRVMCLPERPVSRHPSRSKSRTRRRGSMGVSLRRLPGTDHEFHRYIYRLGRAVCFGCNGDRHARLRKDFA